MDHSRSVTPVGRRQGDGRNSMTLAYLTGACSYSHQSTCGSVGGRPAHTTPPPLALLSFLKQTPTISLFPTNPPTPTQPPSACGCPWSACGPVLQRAQVFNVGVGRWGETQEPRSFAVVRQPQWPGRSDGPPSAECHLWWRPRERQAGKKWAEGQETRICASRLTEKTHVPSPPEKQSAMSDIKLPLRTRSSTVLLYGQLS